MYQELETYLVNTTNYFETINPKRRQLLHAIADYGVTKAENKLQIRFLFICTHNSRRSHFGQVWAKLAAEYYGLGSMINSYSGGTEATAPHANTLHALIKAGFQVKKEEDAYILQYASGITGIPCFSKLYNDPINPKDQFAAIMTCTDADENCPYIPGAERRFSLPYQDPKSADNTALAEKTYAERSFEIATEMMYVTQQISLAL